MAVTSFKEIADGKGGESTGADNSSITRVFRVTTDSKFDTPLTIQPSLPIDYGTTLTGFSNFLCLGVSYSLEHAGPSLSVWNVSFDFKTQAIDQEKLERQQYPNPLDRRSRVTVRSVRYGKLTLQDKNGHVLQTSAGEVYPAQEIDDERWTITVRKNYLAIPDYVWNLQKKINSGPITVKGRVLEPKTVKFGEVVVPEIQIENGQEHFPIEFTLDYKRDTWDLKLLDAGFYYIDGDGNYVRCITRAIPPKKSEISETEIQLDGEAGLLWETLDRDPLPGDAIYNTFEMYEEADFSELPLTES